VNVPILNNFITIAEQVGVVFVIVLLGFAGGRTGLFGDEASDGMANIAVNYVTPALVIMAFQREFEMALIRGFLLTFVGDLLAFFFCVILSQIAIRRGKTERKSVLRAAIIFGNIGMMALPLEQALFGSDGVFYCAASIAVFNLTFWSYCAVTMGEKGEWKSVLKKLFCNPGILGTIVGLIFFFSSITVPKIPATAMNNLANLNMPMCMLVIGQRLSKIPLKTLFNDKGIWKTVGIRLLFVPLVMTAALWLIGIRGPVAVCLVISVAAPTAAAVNILAITYKQDVELAAKSVSMHTILSLISMPILIALVYGWLM